MSHRVSFAQSTKQFCLSLNSIAQNVWHVERNAISEGVFGASYLAACFTMRINLDMAYRCIPNKFESCDATPPLKLKCLLSAKCQLNTDRMMHELNVKMHGGLYLKFQTLLYLQNVLTYKNVSSF